MSGKPMTTCMGKGYSRGRRCDVFNGMLFCAVIFS